MHAYIVGNIQYRSIYLSFYVSIYTIYIYTDIDSIHVCAYMAPVCVHTVFLDILRQYRRSFRCAKNYRAHKIGTQGHRRIHY